MQNFNSIHPRNYLNQLLCHLCGRLQPEAEILTHLTHCLNYVEEPIPYEKTKEFVHVLLAKDKRTKQEILEYNDEAFDIYVRFTMAMCKACNKYLSRDTMAHHYKSCKGMQYNNNRQNRVNIVHLFATEQVFFKDEETSKRELFKLRKEIASHRFDASRKFNNNSTVNKSGTSYGIKSARKRNKNAHECMISKSSSKGLPPSVPEIRSTHRRNNNDITSLSNAGLSPKDNYNNPCDDSQSKRINDITLGNILDDYDETFMSSLTDVNHIMPLEHNIKSTMPKLSDMGLSPGKCFKKPGTITKNGANRMAKVERHSKTSISPLNSAHKVNQSHYSMNKTLPTNITQHLNKPSSRQLKNDGGLNKPIKPYHQQPNYRRKDTWHDKKRSASPNMHQIRKLSRVEVPQGFAQELYSNLSIVTENIRKFQDERSKALSKDKRHRSIYLKEQRVHYNGHCHLKSSNGDNHVGKSYKHTFGADLPTKPNNYVSTSRKIVRPGDAYDKFKQNLRACAHCQRSFTENRITKHERVCLKRASRKNKL